MRPSAAPPCTPPWIASAAGIGSSPAGRWTGSARSAGSPTTGPPAPRRRTPLAPFNLAGRDPVRVAESLNRAGVESRAGCHCATLAHHALGLTPPASCRLSFYLYNTPDEVDHAVAAVAAVAADRRVPPAPRHRSRS